MINTDRMMIDYDRISLERRNKIAIELLSMSRALILELVEQSQNH